MLYQKTYSKKNPNMTFQGECKIPLDCDTIESFVARSRFTKDWLTPKKRKRILGKSRWYRVCLYLTNVSGGTFHSSNAPNIRLDADDLIQVLQVLTKDVMKQYPNQELDKAASYAVLSVPMRSASK